MVFGLDLSLGLGLGSGGSDGGLDSGMDGGIEGVGLQTRYRYRYGVGIVGCMYVRVYIKRRYTPSTGKILSTESLFLTFLLTYNTVLYCREMWMRRFAFSFFNVSVVQD